jgi:hypothetical protein
LCGFAVALSFSQLDGATRDRFSSTHWVHLEGVGGTHLITLTGIVLVDLGAEHGLLIRETC